MNFVLSKLFGMRSKMAKDRGYQDKEMPFLEHLEELRGTLLKIIVTLMLFTIGAFVFARPLMELIRHPVEMAKLGAEVKFPSQLDKLEWRRCEQLSEHIERLPESAQAAFLKRALTGEDERLLPYVQAVPYFQATLALTEKEDRVPWVRSVLENDPEVRDVVLELVRLNPDARVDRQGNLIAMSALRPAEGFTLSLKLSLYAGIIISFPLLLYFIAQFVFPGLTSREKQVILPNIGIGFGLFLMGVLFAYYVVTPRALNFFHAYNQNLGIDSDWRIGEYISFVSQLVLVFGLSFELPVVVMAFVKLELLSYEFMKNNRSYAILILVVVAALITPTGDALTLSFLSGPLIILYEICIWMAFFMGRKERRKQAEEEAARAVTRAAGTVPAGLPAPRPDPKPEPFPLEENDAYGEKQNDEDDPFHHRSDDDDRAGESGTIYEEGFEPKSTPKEPGNEAAGGEEADADQDVDSAQKDTADPDDEPVDPYSSYDDHASAYEDTPKAVPPPAEDEKRDDRDQRVDESGSSGQRERRDGETPSSEEEESDGSDSRP